MIVNYIDGHRDKFGVEPICKVLQMAPSRYYAAKARPLRDAVMMQVLLTLWVANRKVYWAHKLWKAARRRWRSILASAVASVRRSVSHHCVPSTPLDEPQ